jgi:hypothetical protein
LRQLGSADRLGEIALIVTRTNPAYFFSRRLGFQEHPRS